MYNKESVIVPCFWWLSIGLLLSASTSFALLRERPPSQLRPFGTNCSPLLFSSRRHDTHLSQSLSSPSVQPKTLVPNQVLELHSGLELLRAVADNNNSNNNNKLTVILYHASYCKLCQRALIVYKQLATIFPQVTFARYEAVGPTNQSNSPQQQPSHSSRHSLSLSSSDLRHLGVTRFPFVQIYRRGQCVASFSTGPSHLVRTRIHDAVLLCGQRSEHEWHFFVTELADELRNNHHARRLILRRLEKEEAHF